MNERKKPLCLKPQGMQGNGLLQLSKAAVKTFTLIHICVLLFLVLWSFCPKALFCRSLGLFVLQQGSPMY